MPDGAKECARGRLHVEGVAKTYGETPALAGIDLDVAAGEFLALLGPSGCGKTTLLRCIAGLVAVDGGDIRVDERSLLDVAPWKRDVSVVFQSYALFPHMNVAENVGFGLRMRRLDRAVIARRVEEALGLVRMNDFANRLPAQLSGGQQQRVALARAIVVEPTVLLLDEPLAALDAKLRASVQVEIRQLQSRLGITTILVTHDQQEAMTMSDRIAVMNAGHIEQVATPRALYMRPATPFVADFVGDMNRLFGHVESDGNVLRLDGAAVLPLGLASALGPATLMVRPEAVRIAHPSGQDEHSLAGLVEDVRLIGDRFCVFVDACGIQMRATQMNRAETNDALPSPGDRVTVSWRSEDAIIFPGHV